MELAKQLSTANPQGYGVVGPQAEGKPPPGWGGLHIQNFIARSFALHPSRHLQAHRQNLCFVEFAFDLFTVVFAPDGRYDLLAFHRPLYLNSGAALS